MLTTSGVLCNFVGNSDDRKIVSLSRAFTFTLKIQVNRTNQIVRTVVAVLSICKQIWFFSLTSTANSRMEFYFLHLSHEPEIILEKH